MKRKNAGPQAFPAKSPSENAARADKSIVEALSNKPIRLTEGQTELLTKALMEAAEQGAAPRCSETQVIRKPLPKLPAPVPKPSPRVTII